MHHWHSFPLSLGIFLFVWHARLHTRHTVYKYTRNNKDRNSLILWFKIQLSYSYIQDKLEFMDYSAGKMIRPWCSDITSCCLFLSLNINFGTSELCRDTWQAYRVLSDLQCINSCMCVWVWQCCVDVNVTCLSVILDVTLMILLSIVCPPWTARESCQLLPRSWSKVCQFC